MVHLKSKILNFLAASSILATPLQAYEFPENTGKINGSDNVQFLERISSGVGELADQAGRAIVFISVSKIIKGRPYGEIDPFDFFFGPRFRHPGPQEERKMQSGLGSGFIVDLEQGYVITNNHVIEGADEISLKLPNQETYVGKVIGSDKNTDVAVVQIKDKNYNRKGLSQLYLGNSDQLKVGEFALALGAPFGLEASLSFGVISATSRGNLNITSLGNFIQTDAAINPGNSGGPLINMKGEVIGMNTAIYSRTGASAGIGFAVPSNLVRKVADQLIDQGKVSRGYLGVQLAQELDDELTSALSLPKGTKGALIARVEPATPAGKAGLESGDVIISVNKRSVRSLQDLTNAVGLLSPGTEVAIEYYRNGKLRKTSVTLSEFPDQMPIASQGQQDRSDDTNLSGLSVEELNPAKHREWIERYRIESRNGLLVTNVAPGSEAAASGIRPGDVLLEANRVILKNAQDLKRLMDRNKKLLIQLERSGTYLFASLRQK